MTGAEKDCYDHLIACKKQRVAGAREKNGHAPPPQGVHNHNAGGNDRGLGEANSAFVAIAMTP